MSAGARRFPVGPVVLAAVFVLAWFFARDIVKGLESIGVLAKRGLVFNGASDVAFAMVVVAFVLCGYTIVQGARALAGQLRASVSTAEDDHKYAELLRQKEMLLRELKELELDRELRKIEGEDYAVAERRLREKAIRILRALDEADPLRVYEARIQADLQPLIWPREGPEKTNASREGPEKTNAPDASASSLDGADEAWRADVLARPLYRDLAAVLGERDLLLASLRDLWVVAAQIDRADASRSRLTVAQGAAGPTSECTLAELRARVIVALREGDDAESLRLARVVGVGVRREPTGELRIDRGTGPEVCSPAQLRAEALGRLSQHHGLGAAA